MGGGWGIFELQEFFSLSDSLYEFFFRLWHEYFLGLIGVHEFFFHLIFPCANIFFVLHPPPPPSIRFLIVCPYWTAVTCYNIWITKWKERKPCFVFTHVTNFLLITLAATADHGSSTFNTKFEAGYSELALKEMSGSNKANLGRRFNIPLGKCLSVHDSHVVCRSSQLCLQKASTYLANSMLYPIQISLG